MKIRNTSIIFIVSGFWHGANWTFVLWGILNAMYFLPLLLADKNRKHLDIVAKGKLLPNFQETQKIVLTFMLTVLAWIFFRADNLNHAFNYISHIFSNTLFAMPDIFPIFTIFLILLLLSIEWLGREGQHPLEVIIPKVKKPMHYAFYYILAFLVYYFGGKEQDFIYFQF